MLAPIAILGGIALIVFLFLQRGRDDVDLSPRGVLRVYLYLASLAGIVVLALGLASVVNYGLARAAGDVFIYGGQPTPAEIRKCPPGATGCVEPSAEDLARMQRQEVEARERRRNEDLIRGSTYTAFGALFWGAHRAARRGMGDSERGMGALRRAYLMLGTVVFGLATVVLLPTGIYQALSNVLLPTTESYYRQGADALGGGVVSLPIWLTYLRLVVSEFRER
ncbi:MAG: hypothetical protein HYY42_03345 [Chloroflexi bacterium]|nr:hypothetical protein [Chloroflexota bacterium]MBI2983206.1 hypothetical protein [Chloroflexota bacterium]